MGKLRHVNSKESEFECRSERTAAFTELLPGKQDNSQDHSLAVRQVGRGVTQVPKTAAKP